MEAQHDEIRQKQQHQHSVCSQTDSADTTIFNKQCHSIYLETMAEAEVPGGRGRELYVGQSQLELDTFKYLEDGGLLQRWSCTISYNNGSSQVFEWFFLRFSSTGGVRWENKIMKAKYNRLRCCFQRLQNGFWCQAARRVPESSFRRSVWNLDESRLQFPCDPKKQRQ